MYIFQVLILVQHEHRLPRHDVSRHATLRRVSWAQEAIHKRVVVPKVGRHSKLPVSCLSTPPPYNTAKPLPNNNNKRSSHFIHLHNQHIMARTRSTTTAAKPSLMDRLTGKKTQTARVTESTSRNPLTGTTTTTRKTTTHPSGVGHHGNAGKGPLAGTKTTGTRGTGTHHGTATTSRSKATVGTQHRKPTMGDKVSGGLTNLKGSLLGKPGVKVSGSRVVVFVMSDD
jgi:hypothetical protein